MRDGRIKGIKKMRLCGRPPPANISLSIALIIVDEWEWYGIKSDVDLYSIEGLLKL